MQAVRNREAEIRMRLERAERRLTEAKKILARYGASEQTETAIVAVLSELDAAEKLNSRF